MYKLKIVNTNININVNNFTDDYINNSIVIMTARSNSLVIYQSKRD
jgi:hypothetical protein